MVLADRDKQEMEQDFDKRIPDTGATRLVVRSGDPSSLVDLDRVGLDDARSVIVLGDVEAEDGDAHVVKTVLAVLIRLGDRDVPVVAELSEAETGRALREAGPGRVLVVRAPEIIARVTAQACRQPGPLGGLAGPARLRRRRDLLPPGRRPGRPHLRGGPAGLRAGRRPRAPGRGRGRHRQPATGTPASRRRRGHRPGRGRRCRDLHRVRRRWRCRLGSALRS